MTTEQVNIDAYITNVPDDICTCEQCKKRFDINDEGFKMSNDWFFCDTCFADKLEYSANIISNYLRGDKYDDYCDVVEAEDFLKTYIRSR